MSDTAASLGGYGKPVSVTKLLYTIYEHDIKPKLLSFDTLKIAKF